MKKNLIFLEVLCLLLTCFGQTISTDKNCTIEWSSFTSCFNGSTLKKPNWKEQILTLYPAQEDGVPCDSIYTVNQVNITFCEEAEIPLPTNLKNTDCSGYNSNFIKCNNGKCIDKTLACNFEDDCGDNSDEYPIYPKCTKEEVITICGLKEKFGETSAGDAQYLERWLKGIPGINKFSNGLDILSGTYRGSVLDMSPQGSCRKVLIENSENMYYRVPSNVASFRQISKITVPQATLYSNGEDLKETLKNELRFNPDRAGLVNELAGRVGLSQQDQVKEMLTSSSVDEITKVYVQQNSDVTKAEVTLQDSMNLIPSIDFVRRVMDLPEKELSYEKYLNFIKDFGTHYVSEANLGGVFKQIQEFSKCFLEYGDYEKYTDHPYTEVLQTCAKDSFMYSFNPDTYTLQNMCTRDEKGSKYHLHDEAEQTIISTIGGSLSTASKIKFNFGPDTWEAWVDSIQQNPTLISENYKIVEITELLNSRFIPMEKERRKNVVNFLRKSIEIYLGAYDSKTLCDPCIKEGYYSDEKIQGSTYLTGTGPDYKCFCLYDETPSAYTCGASSKSKRLYAVLVSLVITLICI